MNSTKNNPKQLKWSHRALIDRQAIWDYIATIENSPINASLVDARILASVINLETFPLLGKPFQQGLRLLFIPKTQLTIVYRALPYQVRILRIAHQKKEFIQE